MEIMVQDERRLVEIWLSRAERDDEVLQRRLKPIYAAYKAKKYLVAVLCSGDKDLLDSTTGLLRYNQKVSAENDLKRMQNTPLP